MRKILSFITSLILVLSISISTYATVDNSELLKYIPTEQVKLNKSYRNGIIETPEWVDSLILVELRPEMASIGGTLPECHKLIDFYASVGVNGLWIPPIYERTEIGNGYSNCGPHTLEPKITGTTDTEEGWRRVKEFVDYAHSKGIYVFLDVITWGVVQGAPLVSEHPDWFNGEAWGNIAFDWSNEELKSWFTDTLVNNILLTGADGYRCDCEPNYTGYDLFGNVRKRLYEKGKYVIIISEDGSTGSSTYDFEQDGVLDYSSWDRGMVYQNPVNFYADGILNIVDSVKSGTGVGYKKWQESSVKSGRNKYYTNCITNHDYQKRIVKGNRLKIGYAAILAPYIPLWYMGDEFNSGDPDGVLYFNTIDYSEINDPEKSAFFEDVKTYIKIRRTYSDIFEYWPENHRHSNICKVETEGFGSLQAYARFADNQAVLIVPNNQKGNETGKVKTPFKDCLLQYYNTYKVTDLMTGETIVQGTKNEISEFSAQISYEHIGIYLVEGMDISNGFMLKIEKFFVCLPELFLSKIISIM